MEKTRRPYGLWTSPITPKSLAADTRLSDVQWDSDGETLVWLEGRSDKGVLVAKRRGEAPRDLTSDLSVRAGVGYGGGDFTTSQGTVVFASGGRLYRQPLSFGAARPITPPFGEAAAPSVSPDGRWLLFIWSDGVEDVVAVVDLDGRLWPQKLAIGHDFYMQPRWHPSGDKVAWIAWDHPRMPWDGAALELALLDLADGRLPSVASVETIAGGEAVSVFQPEFSPDGRSLAYVSDEQGTGNLHLYDLETKSVRALAAGEEEFSLPAWVQGLRTYGFNHDGREIIARASRDGVDRMRRIDLETGAVEPLDDNLGEYTRLQQVALSPTENAVAAIAGAAAIPARVITCTVARLQQPRVHAYSSTETVSPDDLAIPEPVVWAAPDGGKVHGLYYAPRSAAFLGEGLPPAIVVAHGGPTDQATAGYHASTQFFTTRGYAVLEANYRGSTGYGREYRQALAGNWGVLDVEDVVSGARFLGESGRADRERMVVLGGSAGGYTVLRCLTRYPGVFKAGVSLYGISDLFTLAQDTHKLEAHYLDSLVGPLPQAASLYRERSPLFCAERIVEPVAVFQGEEDRVVPKSQSDRIVASLRERGVPHEYHVYPGEGHGWRKAETIEAYYRDLERFLREHVLFA